MGKTRSLLFFVLSYSSLVVTIKRTTILIVCYKFLCKLRRFLYVVYASTGLLQNYLCVTSELNSSVTFIASEVICGREERSGLDVVPEASSVRISQPPSTLCGNQEFGF